jgi:hypothetical protein
MKTLTLFTIFLTVTACSRTATIYLKNGSVVEAKIRHGDTSNIYILDTGSLGIDNSKGIVNPGLAEECMADRFDKCKDICMAKSSEGHLKNGLKNCIYSCPAKETYRKKCEAVSMEIPIARSDIVEIDHPGDSRAGLSIGFAVVGALLTTAGALMAGQGGPAGAGFGAAIGIPGIVILIPSTIGAVWNIYVYYDSKQAAERLTLTGISPVALSDGERIYWGLEMSWRW